MEKNDKGRCHSIDLRKVATATFFVHKKRSMPELIGFICHAPNDTTLQEVCNAFI